MLKRDLCKGMIRLGDTIAYLIIVCSPPSRNIDANASKLEQDIGSVHALKRPGDPIGDIY